MKGLLTKDFALLKGQKTFFLVIIALALVMSFSQQDLSILPAYMAIALPLFSFNTISYDSFDNGNAFLFTLPISKRQYVLEKYCFSLLLTGAAIILSLLLAALLGAILRQASIADALQAALPVVALSLLIQAAEIPVYLKYGAEQGKVASIVVFGCLGLVIFGIVKLLFPEGLEALSQGEPLQQIELSLLGSIALVIALALLFLSYIISIAIMKKKEF